MKRRTFPVGKSGQAPYQRHGKTPYRYSGAYYAWRRIYTKKAAEGEQAHAAKIKAERDAKAYARNLA